MRVKSQRNISLAASIVAGIFALLTLPEGTGLKWKFVALGLFTAALIISLWVFYLQLKRNSKRKLTYYLQSEWQRRVNAGWEGIATAPGIVSYVVLLLWFYLGVQFDLAQILPRVAFIFLGLIIGSVLLYSGYKFETGSTIYEDRTGGYAFELSRFSLGVTIFIALILAATGVITFIWILLIIAGSGLFVGKLLRFWLPQRWFGPAAVRRAYREMNKPGLIWKKGWRPPKAK